MSYAPVTRLFTGRESRGRVKMNCRTRMRLSATHLCNKWARLRKDRSNDLFLRPVRTIERVKPDSPIPNAAAWMMIHGFARCSDCYFHRLMASLR